MSDETVTLEVRRGLAEEIESILTHEVRVADEYHSTEQYMEDFAEVLDETLEADVNDKTTVPTQLVKDVARSLENEAYHANEGGASTRAETYNKWANSLKSCIQEDNNE